MNFELVEIPSLSGDCCQIFSILIEGEEQTLFENFAEEYEEEYVDEIADMYNSLKFMGNEGGARPQFFKDKEGADVKLGLLGDKLMDKSEVEYLGSLPTLPEIRAKFLSLLNTPASQMVRVVFMHVEKMGGAPEEASAAE